jgi:hypothetical protein
MNADWYSGILMKGCQMLFEINSKSRVLGDTRCYDQERITTNAYGEEICHAEHVNTRREQVLCDC